MKCEIFNNFEALRGKINELTMYASQFPIGKQRTEALSNRLAVIYCDGQFHVRTRGAWGVDVVICKCPQYTGKMAVQAATTEAPQKEHEMTWATYNDHSGDGQTIKKWVDGEGKILIIKGPSGLGKTHICRALQYDFIDKNKSVYYITAHDLRRHLLDYSQTNRERIEDYYNAKNKIKRIKESDILIIDDLGTESQSGVIDTLKMGIQDIVDHFDGRLIVTLNLTIADVMQPGNLGMYGGRIYSRLVGGAAIINLKGTDYRSKL